MFLKSVYSRNIANAYFSLKTDIILKEDHIEIEHKS